MAKEIARCKWCGASPQLFRFLSKAEAGASVFRVECKCGAHGWAQHTEEKAVSSWGGDRRGDGYQQFGPDGTNGNGTAH